MGNSDSPQNGARRRFVALVGQGRGPKVAFRADKVCVRISGLTEGGQVEVIIDKKTHCFRSDGTYEVLGGEFAQAENKSKSPVICELFVDKQE